MTNVKATITSAINAMNASGYTAIPEGLAWGWRVVSPTAPYTEGVDYDDDETIKAIIVMTDGKNELGYSFSAYGYPLDKFGWNTTNILNSKLSTTCNNIKAVKKADGSDAIKVYTIVFDQPDTTIRNLMKNCASTEDDYFYSPTSADLKAAFESIAAGLNNLRVSR
jgi:hypothetical protein